jgi:O-succinylbenzoate synthase
MKLARFDLYRYSLPLSRPLTLGGITLFQREGILLKLSGDDGSEGWGETALFLLGWIPTARLPKTFSRRR